MKNRLAIAIPTCSRQSDDIRIGYVLQALAMQGSSPHFEALDIFIWDEGATAMMSDRRVQLMLDLLMRKRHNTFYMRRGPSRGVAEARRQLLASIPPEYRHILLLDDDLVPMPGSLDALLGASETVREFGFIQGTKIELDVNRTYHNDINLLTQADNAAGLQRQWFGDAAFLLVDRSALAHIRWDCVSRFTEENLPGEDVAMTLMIADQLPCYGLAAAEGYHMSLQTPRWRWEVPSDILQMELLRGVVSSETLRRALPHLERYTRTACAPPENDSVVSQVAA